MLWTQSHLGQSKQEQEQEAAMGAYLPDLLSDCRFGLFYLSFVLLDRKQTAWVTPLAICVSEENYRVRYEGVNGCLKAKGVLDWDKDVLRGTRSSR